MSDSTHTSPSAAAPAPTSSQLIELAAKTVDAAGQILPEIEAVSGLVPGAGPEIVSVEQVAALALPQISRVLRFMMGETGKPLLTVFSDFISHATPGLPNSDVLTGTKS